MLYSASDLVGAISKSGGDNQKISEILDGVLRVPSSDSDPKKGIFSRTETEH